MKIQKEVTQHFHQVMENAKGTDMLFRYANKLCNPALNLFYLPRDTQTALFPRRQRLGVYNREKDKMPGSLPAQSLALSRHLSFTTRPRDSWPEAALP